MEPDADRDVTSTLILWVGARVSGVGLRGSRGGGGGSLSSFLSVDFARRLESVCVWGSAPAVQRC